MTVTSRVLSRFSEVLYIEGVGPGMPRKCATGFVSESLRSARLEASKPRP